jgi:HTH-type transcriptional regulator, transcriptional repressor of NAD biosynthesis genes
VTKYRHALVIGKFYPPHHGHHELIRLALESASTVSVIVMGSQAESIPAADRARWIRAEWSAEPAVAVAGIRCDAPVDIHDETVWAAQLGLMRAVLRTITEESVDVVVSGEGYGDELAARFGAAHIRIDRSTSATAIREDLPGHWEVLAPAVRAGLATRVVVLGAESSGTTTLAGALGRHYQARGGVWRRTSVVDEYGRDYTAMLWDRQRDTARDLNDLIWSASDFDDIAGEQTRREDAAAGCGSPLLVCDTDAFATAIWKRRYLGGHVLEQPPWSQPPLLPRRDLYLLTDHSDVRWENDGLREGDLAIRERMTGWFADALTAAGHSWIPVTGTPEQRLQLAVRSVGPILERRLTLSPPLRGPGFEGPPS